MILTFTYGRPHPIVPGPAKRVTAVVIVCAASRCGTPLVNSILECESGQGRSQKGECDDVGVAWPGSTYPWRAQLRKHNLGSDGKEHPEKSELSRDNKHFKHTKWRIGNRVAAIPTVPERGKNADKHMFIDIGMQEQG